MPHSYTRIFIHAVWATKNRELLISDTLEKQLFTFMKQQFTELGCPVLRINGMPDHVHCLFLLDPKKAITDVIKQIKGSSSHFINSQKLIDEKFSWQTGYGAFGVSESVKDRVVQYIDNQKEHHRKKSFQEEYEVFLKFNGFVVDNQSDLYV
jgi:REP element-mobilizing transposase RayT